MTGHIGRWRIRGSYRQDDDVLDLIDEAHLEIRPEGQGSFVVIAVTADVDWRAEPNGRTLRNVGDTRLELVTSAV